MQLISRFAVIMLSTFSATGAYAYCDPAIDRSVRGEFRSSVYVGRVVVRSVTWLGEDRRPAPLKPPLMLGSIPGGFDPYIGAYYTVDVLETLKGRQLRRFRVFSENTEARTPLRVGQSYLLFLYRITASDEYERRGDLMIDYCGNSAVEGKWAKPLAIVRRLAKRG